MLTNRMALLALPERHKHVTLSPAFNAAVWRMAYRYNPEGWLAHSNAPANLTELRWSHAQTGKIIVSNEHSDRTIYDRPATNEAFRAWHDAGHLALSLAGQYAEFDRRGETAVMKLQQRQLIDEYGAERAAYWCRILEAEIVGQLDYIEQHGHFPADQFAADIAYMEAHHA